MPKLDPTSDVLVRIWFRNLPKSLPKALENRIRDDEANEEWKELAEQADTDPTLPDRVINNLRGGCLYNLLKNLTAQGFQVAAHIALHHVKMTNGGWLYRLSLPFVHVTKSPKVWRDQSVVDWIVKTFIGDKSGRMKTSLVFVLVPKDDLGGQLAVMVNSMNPADTKKGVPVFQLRRDKNGSFWIQDPEDQKGSREVSEEAANRRILAVSADPRAQNRANEAANAILRGGAINFPLVEARVAAREVAEATYLEAGFSTARARCRAKAVVHLVDWRMRVWNICARVDAVRAAKTIFEAETDTAEVFDSARDAARELARRVFVRAGFENAASLAATFVATLPWEAMAGEVLLTIPESWQP